MIISFSYEAKKFFSGSSGRKKFDRQRVLSLCYELHRVFHVWWPSPGRAQKNNKTKNQKTMNGKVEDEGPWEYPPIDNGLQSACWSANERGVRVVKQ